MSYYIHYRNGTSLAHHGIKGQKWGDRNYQYEDGSLTPAGRLRYGVGDGRRGGSSDQGDGNRKRSLKDFIPKITIRRKEKKKEEPPKQLTDEERQKVVRSNDPNTILKYQDQLSDNELREASIRLTTLSQVQRQKDSDDDRNDKLKNFMKKATGLVNFAQNTVNNIVAVKSTVDKFSKLFDEGPEDMASLSDDELTSRINSRSLSSDQLNSIRNVLSNRRQILSDLAPRENIAGLSDDELRDRMNSRSLSSDQLNAINNLLNMRQQINDRLNPRPQRDDVGQLTIDEMERRINANELTYRELQQVQLALQNRRNALAEIERLRNPQPPTPPAGDSGGDGNSGDSGDSGTP